MTGRLLIVGEALCEFVRPAGGPPLTERGVFHGPFPSGAPPIAASAAAIAGARVTLVAAVGRDAFGELFLARMEADGVDVSAVKTVEAVTGVAFVAYDTDGSRRFVFHVANAASAELAPVDLGDHPERVDWMLVSGASLQLSPRIAETTLAAARRVHAAGGKVCLDPNLRPGDAGTTGSTAGLDELAAMASAVLPSEGELDALGVTVDELVGRGAVVCEKHGADGVRLSDADGTEHIPGEPAEEVDPTGCGDTFAGVFLAALMRTGDARTAAREANAAGAAHVQALGPMERTEAWVRTYRSVSTGARQKGSP
jgi:sugar/nucleoside kinase (ribokinase family)